MGFQMYSMKDVDVHFINENLACLNTYCAFHTLRVAKMVLGSRDGGCISCCVCKKEQIHMNDLQNQQEYLISAKQTSTPATVAGEYFTCIYKTEPQ